MSIFGISLSESSHLLVNPQSLQHQILISLQQPKTAPKERRHPIGLRARIGCEPLSEHLTRSDRVTNIGCLLSLGASPLPAANQK